MFDLTYIAIVLGIFLMVIEYLVASESLRKGAKGQSENIGESGLRNKLRG